MFLFKRNNGYYYLVYETNEGKRKNISTKEKTKKEALKFLLRFEKELIHRNSEPTRITSLSNFTFDFLKHTELTRGYKTIKAYKQTLTFLKNYIGDINLASITNSDLKKYLEYRVSSTSIYAARKDLINLKAAFRFATENNYLNSNPCVGIKQFKIPEKQPLYLSKEEYEILISNIEEEGFRNLVVIAVNTGMRLMELLSLKWDQINFETKMILLNNREHKTKTRRVRSVPISHNIYSLLENIKKNSTTAYVFPFQEKHNDVHCSQKFKKYIRKSELNDKYHFHSLRHTFASWLVQNGISIYNVSKLLGHSNIKTTEIYAHLRQDDLLESVNTL